MKKLSLFILLICITFLTAKAQTNAGNQNLGLGFGIQTSTTNEEAIGNLSSIEISKYTLTTYAITPTYSYFIAKNLDLGVSATYSRQKNSQNENYPTALPSSSYPPNSYSTDNNAYSGSLYLRKYILYNNKIGVRTGPYISYEYSKNQSNSENSGIIIATTDKANYYSAGANLDFVYYPSTKIGITASIINLQYSHGNDTSTQAQSSNISNGTSNSVTANFITNNLTLSVFFVLGK